MYIRDDVGCAKGVQQSTHLCFVLLPKRSAQVMSMFVATARVAQRQLARLAVLGLSAPFAVRETLASWRRSYNKYRRGASRVRAKTNVCSKYVETLSVSETEAQSRSAKEEESTLTASRAPLVENRSFTFCRHVHTLVHICWDACEAN